MGKKILPVAASLRLPVCLLMYLAQISEAFAVLQSDEEGEQILSLSGKQGRHTLDIIWMEKKISVIVTTSYIDTKTHRCREYRQHRTHEGNLEQVRRCSHRY